MFPLSRLVSWEDQGTAAELDGQALNRVVVEDRSLGLIYPVRMDQPLSYQTFGEFLSIAWQDGHESLLSQENLRRACPCAHCRGEPDLLGRRLMPADKPNLTAESYRFSGLKAVGNYAWQLFWADGHNTGIYTYDYLRGLCDCDICLKNAAAGD